MNAPISTVFISLEQEHLIVCYQYSKFLISTSLNVIATFCLLKQTPEMQSQLKYYLLYLQLLAVTNDFYFDIAVVPIALVPIIGGYGKGFACRWVSIQDTIAVLAFLLFQFGCIIIICLSYRHQTIFVYIIFRFVVLAVCSSPAIYIYSIYLDPTDTEKFVEAYNISWVRERGIYVIYKRTANITVVAPCLMFAVITITFSTGLAHVAHIMWYIRQGSARSAKSSKRLLIALAVLIVQLGTPYLVIAAPAALFILSLTDKSMLSFDFCYACIQIVNIHSVLHSLVLLLITPAYRKLIVNFFSYVFCCGITARARIVMVHHSDSTHAKRSLFGKETPRRF